MLYTEPWPKSVLAGLAPPLAVILAIPIFQLPSLCFPVSLPIIKVDFYNLKNLSIGSLQGVMNDLSTINEVTQISVSSLHFPKQ
jgi:hypothetical protein